MYMKSIVYTLKYEISITGEGHFKNIIFKNNKQNLLQSNLIKKSEITISSQFNILDQAE